eukprot:gene19773-biopygen8503
MPAPRPRQCPVTPGGICEPYPGARPVMGGTAEDASVSSHSIVWDASGTRPLPFLPEPRPAQGHGAAGREDGQCAMLTALMPPFIARVHRGEGNDS